MCNAKKLREVGGFFLNNVNWTFFFVRIMREMARELRIEVLVDKVERKSKPKSIGIVNFP